jgi:hypothetical protein
VERTSYGDDKDIENSDEESGLKIDKIQDVTALVMDWLMKPKLDSCFLEKVAGVWIECS